MTTRLLPFALSALLLGAGLLVTPPASAVDPEADLTPPVISVPGDLTAEATGPSGATVTYTDATATDDVDGPVPVTCVDQTDQTHTSGDTFPLGTTTLTCTATDTADNTAQATFTITVEDTTAPTVTVPSDITAEATGPSGATVTYTDATATDDVDGPVPVTCVDQTDQTHTSGDTFPLGTTTLTCTATDTADNTAQATFTITVEDTTAPTVTVPSDITAEATGPSGATVTYTDATATDDVDGPVPVTCVDQTDQTHTSGDTFPLGTTTLTCTATDTADNTAQATFTITVEDTTAPTVTVPSDITAEATGPSGATVTYTDATATDDVDGPVPVTCVDQTDQTHTSGDTFPLGTTTLTCTATDTADNTAPGHLHHHRRRHHRTHRHRPKRHHRRSHRTQRPTRLLHGSHGDRPRQRQPLGDLHQPADHRALLGVLLPARRHDLRLRRGGCRRQREAPRLHRDRA